MSVDQRSPEPLRNDISPLLSWLVDGVSPKARFTTATAARMHCRLFDSGGRFVFFSARLKHLKGNKKRKGERRPLNQLNIRRFNWLTGPHRSYEFNQEKDTHQC